MPKPEKYPVKKLLQLDEPLAKDISKFRFERRLQSESEAMRHLMRLGLNAPVAYVEVEIVTPNMPLSELLPVEERTLNPDVTIKMPDGGHDHIYCEKPGIFSFHPGPSTTLHLVLIGERNNHARLGLTEAHLSSLEYTRPRLLENVVRIVPPTMT